VSIRVHLTKFLKSVSSSMSAALPLWFQFSTQVFPSPLCDFARDTLQLVAFKPPASSIEEFEPPSLEERQVELLKSASIRVHLTKFLKSVSSSMSAALPLWFKFTTQVFPSRLCDFARDTLQLVAFKPSASSIEDFEPPGSGKSAKLNS
jgi:hypothetical protein